MARSKDVPNYLNFLIPDVYLKKILCIECRNALSVKPIYSLPDGNSICGRCVNLENPTGYRNKTFETILEFLSFPCMNKQFGCMENRIGNEVYHHEIKCPYRRIKCPVNCDWFGEIDNLLEHYENDHLPFLLKEPSFEVNFVHNYDDVCLLPYAESLFFLRKRGNIEKNTFSWSVLPIYTNEFEKYEYLLSFKNPSNGAIYQMPKRVTEGIKNAEDFVDAQLLGKKLDNPSTIIATIDIMELPEIKEVNPRHESEYLSTSNLEMLKIIECPICMEYMVPPIFQCSGGHSICGECRSQIEQCPTCMKPFGDTQNYAVESFTSFLKYPCKNLERGCEILSSAKDVRQHEKFCSFGSYSCPTVNYTDCKWSGLKNDIWNHCIQQHIEQVVQCPFISLPFTKDDEDNSDEDCFILKFMNNVFILHYEYNSNERKFLWSLQLVGPPELSENYIFDLDVIDRSGRNLRIFIRNICESYTLKDAFAQEKSYIYLTLEQIQPLIHEVLSFKISISKNK